MSSCRTIFKTIGLLLVAAVSCIETHAQNTGIEGKVLDDYGHPISNARVSVTGRPVTVETDEDGLFNITAGNGDKITINASGFYQKELLIRNNKIGDIQLEPSFLSQSRQTDVLYDT